MRKVKLNGEVRFVVDRWDELKLRHLMGLETVDTSSVTEVFAVLSGVSVVLVENAKGLEDAIYEVVRFVYEETPKWKELKPPTHLVIDGKPYKVPSPDKCFTGQNIMLDQLLSKPLLDIIPKALAIYFQPLIDGKFDRMRLEAVERMIMDSNAVDCYATANFFLHGGKNLQRIMRVGSIQLRSTQLEG